jgi:light-harvesting complex 1 beta chain
MATPETAMPRAAPLEDNRSIWIIFALSFLVFMAIALMGQLFGWHWRSWLPGAEGAKGIYGGVKAAVWTFMAHIT